MPHERTRAAAGGGNIRGIETLNHELFHATDYSSGEFSKIWTGLGEGRGDLTRCVMEFRSFYTSYQNTGLDIYKTQYQYWYNQYYQLLKLQ